MAIFVRKDVNVGAVPNDNTGDTLRQGGIDINDNNKALFQTIETQVPGTFGSPRLTFDVTGNATFINTLNVDGGTSRARGMDFGATPDDAGGGIGNTPSDFATIFEGPQSTGHIARGIGFAIGAGVVNAAIGAIDNGGGDATNLAFFAGDSASLSKVLELKSDQVTVFSGDADPAVTEIQDLGSVTFEYRDIFSQNAVTVCDERWKNYLGSADSLVPLMKALDPCIFSRKEKVVKEATPKRTAKRQKTELVEKFETRIIDGIPVRKMIKVAQPLGKMVQVVDADGNPVPDIIIPAVKDKKGNILRPETSKPDMVFVPEMETFTVPAEPEIIVSHGRPHAGFMAQAVKETMDSLGIDDWAGYAYYNQEGEDTHVLRLTEFIAPILAYLQDCDKRIEKLEPNVT